MCVCAFVCPFSWLFCRLTVGLALCSDEMVGGGGYSNTLSLSCLIGQFQRWKLCFFASSSCKISWFHCKTGGPAPHRLSSHLLQAGGPSYLRDQLKVKVENTLREYYVVKVARLRKESKEREKCKCAKEDVFSAPLSARRSTKFDYTVKVQVSPSSSMSVLTSQIALTDWQNIIHGAPPPSKSFEAKGRGWLKFLYKQLIKKSASFRFRLCTTIQNNIFTFSLNAV